MDREDGTCTALPTWLQWIGQVFSFYWLGLGTRSALLLADLASVEIGEFSTKPFRRLGD